MRILNTVNEPQSKTLKTYATREKAEQVAKKEGDYFLKGYSDFYETSPNAIIVAADNGRFAIMFMLTQWLREYNEGGYIGWFASRGHYSI